MLQRATVGGGAASTAVADLPALARSAGLVVVDSGGSFQSMDAATGFALHAATTRAARERIIATGAATAAEVDTLVAELEQPHPDTSWVSTPISLCLVLRSTVDRSGPRVV
jgi:hypothetical protein